MSAWSDSPLAANRKATLRRVRDAGRKGLRVVIGETTQSLMKLVEDGDVYQTVSDDGRAYIFTHPDFDK